MDVSVVVLVSKLHDFQAKSFNMWIIRNSKKAKNTIKTKRSSVFFSSFVSILA